MKPQQKGPIGLSTICFIIVFLSLLSCTHDPVNIDNLDLVCYTKVKGILGSCVDCHDGISYEGFDATSHAKILQSVNPGNPKGSPLYKAITSNHPEEMMPPSGPLSLTDRSIIEVWILQGADSISCDTGVIGDGGGNGTGCSDSIYFVQKILPLFMASCVNPPNSAGKCHDGISQGEEDEAYALNNYPSIRSHVIPKNPLGSPVYKAVKGLSEEFMPPSPFSPLSDADMELMRKWIAEGAKNNACSDAGCADTLLAAIGYNKVIEPIIADKCFRCHKPTAMGGGVNLDTYQHVKYYAETIKPGTTSSFLLGTVLHLNGFIAMPYLTSALDECSIRKIELWIDQGMPEN